MYTRSLAFQNMFRIIVHVKLAMNVAISQVVLLEDTAARGLFEIAQAHEALLVLKPNKDHE